MLKSWDAGTRRPLAERSLDGLGAIRLAPGGQSLAAVENHGVRLLDVASHEPLPGGYLPHPMPVLDVAFSPGGDRILTAQGDGSAQLWDAATRKPLVPPAVLIGSTRGVAFTPDGGTCLAVASDGTIRRWPVPGPIEEPDLARLADRVALMTGQRMGAGQGLDYLPTPEEWRSLRARLVGEGSTALVPPMAE